MMDDKELEYLEGVAEKYDPYRADQGAYINFHSEAARSFKLLLIEVRQNQKEIERLKTDGETKSRLIESCAVQLGKMRSDMERTERERDEARRELAHTKAFWNLRYEEFQVWQRDLPEPYRTEYCNIMANGKKSNGATDPAPAAETDALFSGTVDYVILFVCDDCGTVSIADGVCSQCDKEFIERGFAPERPAPAQPEREALANELIAWAIESHWGYDDNPPSRFCIFCFTHDVGNHKMDCLYRRALALTQAATRTEGER